MTILTILAGLAFSAFLLITKLRDIDSSLNFLNYGMSEGEGFFANTDGSLNVPRSVGVTILMLIGMWAFFIFVPEYGVYAFPIIALPTGLRSLFEANDNYGDMKDKRVRQLAYLEQVRTGAFQLPMRGRAGTWFHPLFQFLAVNDADYATAFGQVGRKLKEFAENPVFPQNRTLLDVFK